MADMVDMVDMADKPHNPYHLEVMIKPIFITINDSIQYSYEGICPKDEGIVIEENEIAGAVAGAVAGVVDDEYAEEIDHIEINFIEDVLDHYLGHIEFNDYDINIIKGILEIQHLSHHKLRKLHRIYEFTDDCPVKYGPSYLKFQVLRADSYCDCNKCIEDEKYMEGGFEDRMKYMNHNY